MSINNYDYIFFPVIVNKQSNFDYTLLDFLLMNPAFAYIYVLKLNFDFVVDNIIFDY